MAQDQHVAEREIKARLSDRWWRLNNLYYIVDAQGQKVLFRPNRVQAAIDDGLHSLNLILKSRQHGVTTYSCIRALDACLFQDNYRAGIIAHKAKDAEEFFDNKIRFAYNNLPDWLKEARPLLKDTGGELKLANGSQLSVSTSFRSGTLQFLHISEYGPMGYHYPEKAKEVKTGALNTVHEGAIVVIESTAKGPVGDFYEKCQAAMQLDRLIEVGEGVLTAWDYKFFFFPWFMDPKNRMNPANVNISPFFHRYFRQLEAEVGVKLTRGQKAWYVKKHADQTGDMKAEHPSTPQEAFEASIEGAYWATELVKAQENGQFVQHIPLSSAPVETYWDIGRSDSTSIWFVQRNGPWWDCIDFYENSGENLDHYVRVMGEKKEERGWAAYGTVYFPHDGANTDWTSPGNQSRDEVMRGHGFTVEVVPRCDDLHLAIEWARNHIRRCRFDMHYCGPDEHGRGGIPSLQNYRKRYNEQTDAFSDTPLKNWAIHGADAFRQIAQAFEEAKPEHASHRRGRKEYGWQHV